MFIRIMYRHPSLFLIFLALLCLGIAGIKSIRNHDQAISEKNNKNPSELRSQHELELGVGLKHISTRYASTKIIDEHYIAELKNSGYDFINDSNRGIMIGYYAGNINKAEIERAYNNAINSIEQKRMSHYNMMSVATNIYIAETSCYDEFRKVIQENNTFIIYDIKNSRLLWSTTLDLGHKHNWVYKRKAAK